MQCLWGNGRVRVPRGSGHSIFIIWLIPNLGVPVFLFKDTLFNKLLLH